MTYLLTQTIMLAFLQHPINIECDRIKKKFNKYAERRAQVGKSTEAQLPCEGLIQIRGCVLVTDCPGYDEGARFTLAKVTLLSL